MSEKTRLVNLIFLLLTAPISWYGEGCEKNSSFSEILSTMYLTVKVRKQFLSQPLPLSYHHENAVSGDQEVLVQEVLLKILFILKQFEAHKFWYLFTDINVNTFWISAFHITRKVQLHLVNQLSLFTPNYGYAYSPYCSLYISWGVNQENLFNNQGLLISFFLRTLVFDSEVILQGEIRC